MYSMSDASVPEPLRSGLRGVGQVFFQENALTGACFVLGLTVSSLVMAIDLDLYRATLRKLDSKEIK